MSANKKLTKKQIAAFKKTARPKIIKHPINCAVCTHDMGLSRAKAAGVDSEGNFTWKVRCNNCKTVYTAIARFPEPAPVEPTTTELPDHPAYGM